MLIQVHQNLCVGKTLWEKTLTREESYVWLMIGDTMRKYRRGT